jgi:adenylate cyclase
MKKYLSPLLGIVVVLLVFSYLLHERHKSRFGVNEKPQHVVKFLETLEWNWYDFKFRFKPSERAKNVLVAKIDDASLAKYGRWPWSRYIYKEILDNLYALGAEVVAFDAVFSEPEFRPDELEYMLSAKPKGFADSVRNLADLKDAQVHEISQKLPQVGESIFADGISNTSTVLGYIWERDSSCRVEETMSQTEEERRATRALGLMTTSELIESFGTLINQSITHEFFPPLRAGTKTSLLTMQCPIANRSGLTAKAVYQGQFNAMAEDDGIFRRMPLIAALDTTLLEKYVPADEIEFLNEEWLQGASFFPSLALQSVLAYLDRIDEGDRIPRSRFNVELARDREDRIYAKSIRIHRKNGMSHLIPVLPDGTIPLRFYGSQHEVPHPIGEFSLARSDAASTEQETNVLFAPSFREAYSLDPAEPLKDKIVIIGPTAIGVYDLRPNPVQGDAGGVFLHATAVSRILDYVLGEGSNVAMTYPSQGVNLALLWGVGLIVSLTTLLSRGLRGSWGFLIVVGGFLAMDYWLFKNNHVALDSMSILLCVLILFVMMLAYKYFTEERDRAFVKGAFEKYVSPDVVGSILDDPKKLNLGGERRELSVLFSDVRGFTNISEKMGAAELAKFMNDYLTPMTEIIQAERGTIDKYMGDAIMAIFGAPIRYEEHAAKAVEAGLRMLEDLEQLKVGWREQGLPDIDIGVGVNTGEMSVGNMGSTRIFSYTVMGDSVNLGSRLEGLTKEYAVKFIISDYTRTKLGDAYICRELDRVKVKGKAIPVTIFEVVGRSTDSQAAELRAKAVAFESALQKYYAQDFASALVAFDSLKEKDDTASIYSERCALWLEAPPPEGWDGSWTMKTK